jgi:hypothetical protein
MHRIPAIIALGLPLGLCTAVACWRVPEGHCGNVAGDLTCAERGMGRYCDGCRSENDGCTEVMPSAECHVPGPWPESYDETSSSGGASAGASSAGATESSMGSSTMTPASASAAETTHGSRFCENHAGCEESKPFCDLISEMCVGCDQLPDPHAACATRDPMMPACVDGSCQPCAASPAVCGWEACHPDLGMCLPRCAAHSNCETSACELEADRCFPESPVVHVDGDGGRDAMSIGDALDSMALPPGGYGIIVVHELDGEGSYLGSVTIDEGRTIALLAAPGEQPVLEGLVAFSAAATLWIQDEDTSAYIDGLWLMDGPGWGLIAQGGMAWVDNARMSRNIFGDIEAQDGARLTLRNCFVGDGGAGYAVHVVDSSATILYSTIGAGSGWSAGLMCSSPLGVDVRNSIILPAWDLVADIDCPEAMVSYSATKNDFAGDGNVAIPDQDLNAWFEDYESGDFHLKEEGFSQFGDIAQWQQGDPVTDIDDSSRLVHQSDKVGADAQE